MMNAAAEVHVPSAPPQSAEPEMQPPASGTTTTPGPATIYPGDKNGLPYDVVIQPLHFDEPEQGQPEKAPATENFRIIDDKLGVGSQREKFRRNMDAINTLQAIELEGRAATLEEQEILSRYVGWGGLPQVFDENNSDWANEFLELQAALNPQNTILRGDQP